MCSGPWFPMPSWTSRAAVEAWRVRQLCSMAGCVVAALVDRYMIIRRSNCSRSCSDIGLPDRWASCHVTWSRWRDWFIFTICSWSLHKHVMHAYRGGHKQNKTTWVNGWHMAPTQGTYRTSVEQIYHYAFFGRLAGFYLKVHVPGEAKMLGELCEDEVFSQQGVRLSRLDQLLRGQGN